jgi:hypothetical protein
MATEMVVVTDSNDKDFNANANNSASTTVARTTCPGCASRWWRWRQYQWWGGSTMATGGCCVGNSTPGGCCDGSISTMGCAAPARYNLLPHQPEWPGIPPPPGAEGWGGRDMVVKMRMWREEMYWRQIRRKDKDFQHSRKRMETNTNKP